MSSMISDLNLAPMLATIVYSFIGIVVFLVAYWVLDKLTPFSIKKEIEDEYQLVREMQIEEEAEMDRQKFLMDEGEKEEMIAALKKKWEVVHKEY